MLSAGDSSSDRSTTPGHPGGAARAPRNLARDAEGGAYLQALLVSAVASVLVTRFYLTATGFPRVGRGELHIAHMLWGGLLMLAALVLVLAVLGRRAKRTAAVVGGVGFGLFVDELGKFVTADNDYFFQPTIALIYLLLVALFLAFRAVERRSLSSDELLANAADTVRELVLGGATEAEVARGLALLARSGTADALAEAIRGAIAAAAAVDADPPWTSRVAARAWRAYDAMLQWRWYLRAVLVLFVGQAVLSLVAVAGVIAGRDAPALSRLGAVGVLPPTAVPGGVGLASASASALLVAAGVVALARGARLSAYRWFERSVLVAVLVTQVVLFWHDQLAALGGLAWNLVLLSALRYMIRQELGRAALRQVSRA
jgi:hypothetical protein